MEIKNLIMQIEEIKDNPKNPRKINREDLETLKKSLEEFPEMKNIREVVVDENKMLLGGHQRIKAMKELGETEVFVKQVFGLSDKQKDEFVIKDNVASGSWDRNLIREN